MRGFFLGLFTALCAFAGAFFGSDREAVLGRILGSQVIAIETDDGSESQPDPEPAPPAEPTIPDGKALVDIDEIGATVYLSRSTGGNMRSTEFRAQGGIYAKPHVELVEKDCSVTGFNLIYIPRRQDPIASVNAGPRYNDQSRRMVAQAKPGDIYAFTDARVKCDPEGITRRANSMVFFIR